MRSISDVQLFYGSLPPEKLRERASNCDARAAAADADNDAIDAGRWRDQAREFRRLARDKEFPA